MARTMDKIRYTHTSQCVGTADFERIPMYNAGLYVPCWADLPAA